MTVCISNVRVLTSFHLYRNRPISAFAGAVMELSYLEDWKMAKGVIF